MKLINYLLKLTDLPPEIHHCICNHIKSPTDKLNFALTSVTIYNSLDIGKITHNIKMKSIIKEINSIKYKINKPLIGLSSQSSKRTFGEHMTHYVFWKYDKRDNKCKYRSFAGQLNCFTDGQIKLKNNCGRTPITHNSPTFGKSQIYTLNTPRKCIVDWSIYSADNCIMFQIFDNNSLKTKKYKKYN